MRTEEQIQSYTSNIEPQTGNKRQRDEDHTSNPHPNSRSISGNGSLENGNFMPGALAASNAPVHAMPGYDALYIGDLQWVRYFVRCPHVYIISKMFYVAIYVVDD